jgi:outer membrane receptor protein involved in Fe transport
MFVLSADYQDDLFRAGVSGKYTGERFVNLDNTFPADEYFLVDAYVGVRGEAIADVLKAIELSLVVNNLLDTDYLGGISGNAAWIGAPRTVTFTATLDF